MVLRDQRKALYGDSPPPPRKAAPYPEVEVIYRCNDRFVVRHGNTVTKYTTHPDGMGVNRRPSEAMTLQFVKDHTTIPVPEVISSDWDRITMEYVEGQNLKEA
jgi:predicted Ser/Thr protein kinase